MYAGVVFCSHISHKYMPFNWEKGLCFEVSQLKRQHNLEEGGI